MWIGRRSQLHRFRRDVTSATERESEELDRLLQTTFQQTLGSYNFSLKFLSIGGTAVKVGMRVAAKFTPVATPVADLIPSQREETPGPFDQIVLELQVIFDWLRCNKYSVRDFCLL